MDNRVVAFSVAASAALGSATGLALFRFLNPRRSKQTSPPAEPQIIPVPPLEQNTSPVHVETELDETEIDPMPRLEFDSEGTSRDLGDSLGVTLTLPNEWRHIQTDAVFPCAQAQFVCGDEGLGSVCQPFITVNVEDLGRNRRPGAASTADALEVLTESVRMAASDFDDPDDALAIAGIVLNEAETKARFQVVSPKTGNVVAVVYAATVVFADGLAATVQYVNPNPDKDPSEEPLAFRIAAASVRRARHPWAGESRLVLRSLTTMLELSLPLPRCINITLEDSWRQALPENSTFVTGGDSSTCGSAEEPFEWIIAICPIGDDADDSTSTSDFVSLFWAAFGARGWLPFPGGVDLNSNPTSAGVAALGCLTHRELESVAVGAVFPRRLSATSSHSCVFVASRNTPSTTPTTASFQAVKRKLSQIQYGLTQIQPGPSLAPIAIAAPTLGVEFNAAKADAIFPLGWCCRRPAFGETVCGFFPAQESEALPGGAILSLRVAFDASGVSASDVVDALNATPPEEAQTVLKDGRLLAVKLRNGSNIVNVSRAIDVTKTNRFSLSDPILATNILLPACDPFDVEGRRRVMVVTATAMRDEPLAESTAWCRRVGQFLAGFE